MTSRQSTRRASAPPYRVQAGLSDAAVLIARGGPCSACITYNPSSPLRAEMKASDLTSGAAGATLIDQPVRGASSDDRHADLVPRATQRARRRVEIARLYQDVVGVVRGDGEDAHLRLRQWLRDGQQDA